jgi:hypothetical protein
MAFYINSSGNLMVNGSGLPIDCSVCPCVEGPCDPVECDTGGQSEYTVTFFGDTLTNEDCEDCNSCFVDVPFVLTYDLSPPCGSNMCCWQYVPACCGSPVIILIINGNLVTLSVIFGLAEAQWVWDRGASLSCDAGTISSNLAWDLGAEFLCSDWINLNVSVE